MGNLHGSFSREAQFAGGFLLQSRGCERRRRITVGFFALDIGDAEFLSFDFGFGFQSFGFGIDVKFLELFTVERYQVRFNQRLGFGN